MQAQVERLARRVVDAYGPVGVLDFAFGNGSTFAGYSENSDLDICLVWNEDVPDANDTAPATSALTDPEVAAQRYELTDLALDKFMFEGREVDVVQHPRRVFESWVDAVLDGNGWKDEVWPLPLYAVAGFIYGIDLHDPHGIAAHARERLAHVPEPLVRLCHETLTSELPSYEVELAASARRGDGWLFHSLLTGLLRTLYVTWFAVRGHYCPHPKWLHHWIRRFDLDTDIAALERELWTVPELDRRLELVLRMADRVLSIR